MAGNVVALDLTRFSPSDLEKIETLQKKLRMMQRWCRIDHVVRDGRECLILYSGDRGPCPYACYHLYREHSGLYFLEDGRSCSVLATKRTLDDVIDALPDDFYYTRYGEIR